MAEPSDAPHLRYLQDKSHEILNVRAEVTRRQTRMAEAVEAIGRVMAHPPFFVALLAGHLLWIVLNLPVWPWFEPWDPYPFMFLATVTSAEAPFIALLILMYQRRNSRISELREELDTQIALHVEREVTVALRLLGEVQTHLAIESREDPQLLERLRQELDPQALMQHLRAELAEEEQDEAIAP